MVSQFFNFLFFLVYAIIINMKSKRINLVKYRKAVLPTARLNRVKKFDVVTIGGATRDIMFYSGEGELVSTGNLTKQKLLAFEYGAKILADKLYFSYGGGAANTAVSFSRLGLKTGVICKLGNDDNGKEVIKNFRARKVDTSLIKIDKKAKTGFSMILTVNSIAKEHVLFAYRGANNLLIDNDLSLSKIMTDWYYIPSLPERGWENIIRAVIRQKAKIAWNPGGSQLATINKVKIYLPKINLLILNKDEALEFRKLKNIKGLIKYIHSLGPKIVVITDGEKGAYVYDGQKYYYMKVLTTSSVDTVGVGDAFASAFTSAIIYDKNIKLALKWGITNSASVVGKVGAQNGLLSLRQLK